MNLMVTSYATPRGTAYDTDTNDSEPEGAK
jgi:hypothetical protein